MRVGGKKAAHFKHDTLYNLRDIRHEIKGVNTEEGGFFDKATYIAGPCHTHLIRVNIKNPPHLAKITIPCSFAVYHASMLIVERYVSLASSPAVEAQSIRSLLLVDNCQTLINEIDSVTASNPQPEVNILTRR
jgi:hypothetical protein